MLVQFVSSYPFPFTGGSSNERGKVMLARARATSTFSARTIPVHWILATSSFQLIVAYLKTLWHATKDADLSGSAGGTGWPGQRGKNLPGRQDDVTTPRELTLVYHLPKEWTLFSCIERVNLKQQHNKIIVEAPFIIY